LFVSYLLSVCVAPKIRFWSLLTSCFVETSAQAQPPLAVLACAQFSVTAAWVFTDRFGFSLCLFIV
jgi:hypothetical protein